MWLHVWRQASVRDAQVFLHGVRNPLSSCVVCNRCPSCKSMFSSIASAREHVKHACERGYCRIDKAHIEYGLIAPKSWDCPMGEFSI